MSGIHGKPAEKLILLLILAVPLLISPSTTYLHSPKFPALQVLGFAALAARLARGRGEKTPAAGYPLDIPVMVFFAWTALSVSWAYNKHLAAERLVSLAALVAVYYVVSRTNISVRKLTAAALAAAAAVSIYGIFQFLGHDFLSEPRARPVSFMGNANFAGEFVAPVIILALALLLESRGRRAKILTAALILLQSAYLSMTNARGAWLGLAAGGAVFLAVSRVNKARALRAALYSALAVSCALFLVTLGRGAAFIDRLAGDAYRMAGMEHPSAASRLDIWTVAFRIIRDNPVAGTGAGNFHVVYPAYGTYGEYGVIGERAQVNFAHNDFIQAASDLGLAGFAVFAWLLVSAGGIIRRNRSRFSAPEAGAAGGFACILASSMFGFPLETPSTAMLFWVFLGVFSAKGRSGGRRINSTDSAFPVKAGSFILLILVTIFSLSVLLSDYHLNRAARRMRDEDWPSAAGEIRRSMGYYYPNASAHAMLASAYLQKNNLEEGYRHLQKTLYFNPNHRWANGAAGQLYLNAGRYDEAVEHIEKSVRMRPSLFYHLAKAHYMAGESEKGLEYIKKQTRLGAANEYSYFYLGLLSEEKGDKGKALRAYRRALELNPRLQEAAGRFEALGETP